MELQPPTLTVVETPSTPAVGSLKLHARLMAGREMVSVLGSDADKSVLQSNLGRNMAAWWVPIANSATVPAGEGLVAPTSLGTATARAPATTNMATRASRLGYVTAATAGLFSGQTHPTAQFTIGGGGVGGFHLFYRFVVADAITAARMFVGMSTTVAAPTNVEPNTLTNSIGVAKLSGSANLAIVYGGSTAQTAIDLGANFPASTSSTDLYELQLYASPNNSQVGYRVERLNTGQVASGILTAATAGTQLPLNTALMAPRAWRTNNATATAVGLDVARLYVETDN